MSQGCRALRPALATIAIAIAAATALAAAGPSLAKSANRAAGLSAADARLGHAGRWITDQDGRVRVLHGLDLVNKLAADGYAPDAQGFGANDAQFLADNGFNVVRLGIIWKALEPQPGVFDAAYLDRIYRTYEVLHRHGIAVLLDFHQDLYNERFQGEGAPDWAVLGQAATETPTPLAGFPNNYILQNAVNQAFDAFWANDVVPGTHRGVQQLFAGAWAHVARRFAGKPGIVGYNLYNEPWPGTLAQAGVAANCAITPTSCGVRHFEATTLMPFYRRVDRAIRAVDPRTVIYPAPTLVFDFGFASGLGKLGNRTGFAFNAYCGQAVGLAAVIPFLRGRSCSSSARLSFRNARAVSRRTGDALFMTEFGASDDLASFAPYLDDAESSLTSWTEWAYCGCGDPTTTGSPESEALVLNPRRAPSGTNVDAAKLKLLATPYPTVVSGTPKTSKWSAKRRTYRLTFTSKRADGGPRFGAGSISEFAAPKLQYPSGYQVAVRGARVVSKNRAAIVEVALCPGARTASVSIKPGHTSSAIHTCR